MNVHRLELFYYVARHGGISRAVRHIPYGIGQPAVSSQVLQLEQELGVRLFERTPFRLTPAGAELQEFVNGFFGRLEEVAGELRGDDATQLRIASSELVLRDHLPAVIARMSRHGPKPRMTLRSGFHAEIMEWLAAGEVDVAVIPLSGRPARQLRCQRLLRVPLVLLVPRRSPLRSAEELWARDKIDEALISLPAAEVLSRQFQAELRRRRVDWPLSIEASSMELITRYAANGYGIGISVDMKSLVGDRAVRRLPLPGFAPLDIWIVWRREFTPVMRALLEEGAHYVRETWPAWAHADAAS